MKLFSVKMLKREEEKTLKISANPGNRHGPQVS